MNQETKLGPLTSGLLKIELTGWGVGVLGSWEVMLPAGETYDLGTLLPDQALFTHTVIIDTEETSLDPAPRVMGRTSNGTVAGNAHYTGLRHKFLTTAPIEAVFISHGHGKAAPPNDLAEHPVTGSETHLSLD